MTIAPLSTEQIAVSALQYLAEKDDQLMRFSALTGILPNDIRQAASQPGFFVGLLDFLLGHEPDLLAFCEHINVQPETVVAARHALANDDRAGYE